MPYEFTFTEYYSSSRTHSCSISEETIRDIVTSCDTWEQAREEIEDYIYDSRWDIIDDTDNDGDESCDDTEMDISRILNEIEDDYADFFGNKGESKTLGDFGND